MFYPCIPRVPGWAAYHKYQNLKMEDPEQNGTLHDLEANGELQRLLSPEQERPKPKCIIFTIMTMIVVLVTLIVLHRLNHEEKLAGDSGEGVPVEAVTFE